MLRTQVQQGDLGSTGTRAVSKCFASALVALLSITWKQGHAYLNIAQSDKTNISHLRAPYSIYTQVQARTRPGIASKPTVLSRQTQKKCFYWAVAI